MKNFTIENETNNIMVHGSAKEAELIPNSERFTSEAALLKLAAEWPAARLIEIWNSLPGVTEVKKFKDRATAVSRIWKALQTLGDTEAEVAAEQPEAPQPEALVSTTTETTPDTDVAPQPPDVAPAEPGPEEEAMAADMGAETAPVDVERCTELLKTAALAQGEYWGALRNLEEAIGFEIDDLGELDATTVDDLIAQHEARRKPKTPRAKTTRENSKTSQVIAMLKREGGTTLEEIMTAMTWQKHSTRAMLSAGGSLVKKHGLTVTSEMVGETRRYSIKS